jgi:hypothetical protein
MRLAAGAKLDAYEILGPIGAGGMGEVYRARDLSLKREVAIKILPAFVTQDSDRLRRFEQEAQAAAALNHPNILAVHRFGSFEGAPYLVSELLVGETLREALDRGPHSLRKTIDYGVQIAHGLAAAHDKGIVHRDLKPENLFITKEGRVKILDFGLAKLKQQPDANEDADCVGPTRTMQTEPGVVMGTVGYMSPEQVRGKTIDHRTDIFAFGAILYEMLTGKRSFQRSTLAETMTAILNDDPPGISQVAQSTPPGLQRVVHRCLEKNPEQRFQSASDLAFALEALSDSGSGSVNVIHQPSRSHWVWAVAAAAVVALAAAGIAWWRIPPAVPVVESVTQLTDDGEPKLGPIGIYTDGSRIYFNEGPVGSRRIAEASVNGGPIALVDTKLDSPVIFGLAGDGSVMLAATGSEEGFARPLWSIPLPAGEPRRIRDIEAMGAAYFPDGRIVFTKGTDVFVADKDGANQRKLVSVTGVAYMPNVSPDGQTISITMAQYDTGFPSLVEVAANAAGFRTAYPAVTGGGVWSSDGRYLLYPDSSSDIWALPVKTGLLHRSRPPTRLTTGPLLYTAVCPSRDGKRLFALATRQRGELVRYDSKSRQFLPLLSGISALEPTFSRDGKWVAYASYPDGTLWRSRSDGSDKLQLTYPPMEVDRPRISPDGTKVAFSVDGRTFVVDMSGALPPEAVAKGDPIWVPGWSPDGNLLVVASTKEGAAFGGQNSLGVRIVDLRTGKTSVVPCPEGMAGTWWVNQNTLVAATQDFTKFMTFDLKTQKWTPLTAGALTAWAVSPDGQYLYYSTGGAEPRAWRLRFADHKIEMITSLTDPSGMGKMGWVQAIDVAPDGSAIFTRETGSQEVYALNVRWP